MSVRFNNNNCDHCCVTHVKREVGAIEDILFLSYLSLPLRKKSRTRHADTYAHTHTLTCTQDICILQTLPPLLGCIPFLSVTESESRLTFQDVSILFPSFLLSAAEMAASNYGNIHNIYIQYIL